MSPATNHQDDIDIPHSDMRRHDAVPIRQYANKLPAKRAKRASPGATIVSELCCSLFAKASESEIHRREERFILI